MNVRKVNLNLLVALDALLTEGNVSRAAQKIFITQPAMSNALIQLRALFKDALLVRSGRQMMPTPKALAIAPKVREILRQIEETLSAREVFNSQTTERTFRIGMSDYAEFLLLPLLSAQLTKLAPNISIKVIHANVLNDPLPFTEGKFDLGIGIAALTAPFIRIEPLFTDEAICAARTQQLTSRKMTLTTYLAAKHLAIAQQDEPALSATDAALEVLGVHRSVALAVPHLLSAMQVLAKTPLLATVPKRLALALQRQLKLTICKPPFTIPPVTISLLWHERFATDAGHQWLRELIKQLAQDF